MHAALSARAAPSAGLMSPRAWLLLGSLYTTQYLGLGFFVVALAALLRERGAPLETVGLAYMLGLVWPLKALWAPMVDRVRFGSLGHYRGWLLATQAALVGLLMALGTLDLMADFPLVYALCLAVALTSATQDIAVDGLACRLLAPAQRGLGNGLQIAGGLIGNLLGGGAVLMAYPVIGWGGAMAVLACGTSVSLIQLLVFREPERPARTVTTRLAFARFLTFWRSPGAGRLIWLLLLFPMGSAMAYAVITPALVDAGWPLARIGLVVNIAGSLTGLGAAMATGWCLGRIGRRTALIAGALIQAAGVLAVLLVVGDGGTILAGLGVLLFFLGYNPSATVLATLMMDRAAQDSPATDYTLQVSITQIAAMGTMTTAASLAAVIGYGGVVVLAVAASLAAAALSLGYRAPGADLR